MQNAILGGLLGAILGLCGGIWYGHMIAMRVINKATEPTVPQQSKK